MFQILWSNVAALTQRWLGPYPALALSLPDLSSPAQKAKQLAGDYTAKGVTLDFVLDTASNTNTINAQVAGPTSQGGLELTQVGSVAGGVGAGGAIGGGATFMLGNAELADVPAAERIVFMSGITATALPVPAPTAAGLLGAPFLNSFAGGVDIVWGPPPLLVSASAADAAAAAAAAASAPADTQPSITFYGDEAGCEALRVGLSEVPVKQLDGSGLPSVILSVNGVAIPALLDTGSPITVLNAAAANAAGLAYASLDVPAASSNPFVKAAAALKTAQAAASGDILMIAGSNGSPVQLVRSEGQTAIGLMVFLWILLRTCALMLANCLGLRL